MTKKQRTLAGLGILVFAMFGVAGLRVQKSSQTKDGIAYLAPAACQLVRATHAEIMAAAGECSVRFQIRALSGFLVLDGDMRVPMQQVLLILEDPREL